MLAFDFPTNDIISVEYVGLSQAATTAESQKDILRRMISVLLPTAGEIVDVSEVPQRRALQGLFIRCIQCDVKRELSQYSISVQEEARFRELTNLSRSQFKLHLTPENQQTITWNVEIGTRKLVWYPMLKAESIGVGGKLSKANFSTLSCIEGVTCPQTQLYINQSDCDEKIHQWVGRQINTATLPSLIGRSSLVMAEKIPFIHEVKAQSTVRALVTSKNSTLTIKTSAKALKSGGVGDIIPVEISTASNSSQKGRFIEARVVGEGEVEIVR